MLRCATGAVLASFGVFATWSSQNSGDWVHVNTDWRTVLCVITSDIWLGEIKYGTHQICSHMVPNLSEPLQTRCATITPNLPCALLLALYTYPRCPGGIERMDVCAISWRQRSVRAQQSAFKQSLHFSETQSFRFWYEEGGPHRT